jgi:hypothetical protein
LLSDEAACWLEWAGKTEGSLTARIERLRAGLSIARTHLVIEQARLRERAGDKFRAARQMYFAALGLEQSTDEVVASYKAQRFPVGTKVLDLCTGIGGDLLALARRGPVEGVERDPAVALLAAANLRVLGTQAGGTAPYSAVVRVQDACEAELPWAAAWHIDPDRRPAGRRTTRVESHQPDAAAIEQMLSRNGHAAIKLAPATEWPESWTARAELEWISRDRQCRQLVAWFGDLAQQPGRRRATVLGGAGQATRTVVGTSQSSLEPPAANAIDAYLFEPDAAVIAAKLSGVLAGQCALRPIATGAVYLTGPRPLSDPGLSCFQVLDTLPFRIKPLQAWLRQRNIGRLEIKKRGVDHDPQEVRRQLKLRGDASATLLIARIEQRVLAVIARRQGTA